MRAWRSDRAGRQVGATALALCALALLVAACDRAPDVGQVRAYSKDGISFSYPGNWSVTEDDDNPSDGSSRTLSVDSSGDPMVTVVRMRMPAELSPDQYPAVLSLEGFFEKHSEYMIEKMRAQVSSAVPVRRVVAGAARDGLERTVKAKLLKQKIVLRLQMFRIESPGTITFLMVMVASEDWESMHPGVELVLTSFKVA